MKNILILMSLFSITLHAQTSLNFDKRFDECEDKWVAFQMNKDSTYNFGFIYLDLQAGLTLDLQGTFKITRNGTFIPKRIDTASIKIRLKPNRVRVAIIPGTKFEELKIKEYPEWLKYYRKDTASIERLYRWGFLYNSWDESTKALTYLERAQKINPKFKGLEFELAYAYNALGQYDKAISTLESAIKTSPDECYLYKELSYAQMHLGQLDKASETCKKGISVCTEKPMKSEIAYNLTYQYYKIKDQKNFRFWADETKKWATQGDMFMTNIIKMEAEMGK
ncbi:MAG TPA: tetratricopeptide repeat protein [Bacteroidales bacterium]